MEVIKLETNKKPKKDTYTDPSDANAEPCLAKDSLSLKKLFIRESVGWAKVDFRTKLVTRLKGRVVF